MNMHIASIEFLFYKLKLKDKIIHKKIIYIYIYSVCVCVCACVEFSRPLMLSHLEHSNFIFSVLKMFVYLN
jgi:hypothetical protein